MKNVKMMLSVLTLLLSVGSNCLAETMGGGEGSTMDGMPDETRSAATVKELKVNGDTMELMAQDADGEKAINSVQLGQTPNTGNTGSVESAKTYTANSSLTNNKAMNSGMSGMNAKE